MNKQIFFAVGIHTKYNRIWILKGLENIICTSIFVFSIYKNI